MHLRSHLSLIALCLQGIGLAIFSAVALLAMLWNISDTWAILGAVAGAVMAASGSLFAYTTAWSTRCVATDAWALRYALCMSTFIFMAGAALHDFGQFSGDNVKWCFAIGFLALVFMPLQVLWLRMSGQTVLLMDALLCPVVLTLLFKVIKYLQNGPLGSTDPLSIVLDPAWLVGAIPSAVVTALIMWGAERYGVSRSRAFAMAMGLQILVLLLLPDVSHN